MKCYSYLAWMRDNTLKVGYSFTPFFRIKRGLTSSSFCFLCLRIEHPNKDEAKLSEAKLKKQLEPCRIKDSHCQEWFHLNKKGIKKIMTKALKNVTIEWAGGIGNKHATDWAKASPEEKKIILKKLQ